MQTVDIGFEYTPAQNEVFFNSAAKKRIVRKGRRVGFTFGAAQYVIETMLDGTYKRVLWGDTVLQNIRNYFERYFMPALKPLPKSIWDWRVTDKIFRLNGAMCDFRAAETPENWEGFGYDLIILNEAGIILRNRYLWENAVRPMLLDNPDSVCIIGGTPKGKGLFYELFQQAGATEGWQQFAYTTYDNPKLSKAAINELIAELGGAENVIRQEIHGEFIDETSAGLFQYGALLDAMARYPKTIEPPTTLEIWGLDVARHGDDNSVLAKRRDTGIYAIERMHIPDLNSLADRMAAEYSNAVRKPDAFFIEVTGIGWGVFDILTRLGVPVVPADVGKKAVSMKVANKRAEMYKGFSNTFIERRLYLPDDKRLLAELAAVEYEIADNGVLKLMPKEAIKKNIGYSPDSADACALTFYAPVVAKTDVPFDTYLPTGGW